MKKPAALNHLLEELKGEDIESNVESFKDSKAVIYSDDEAAVADDGIELTPKECALLLSSPTVVERLHEALGCPTDASITLYDISVDNAVLDALEKNFAAVDDV